jgi:hypothetical protein
MSNFPNSVKSLHSHSKAKVPIEAVSNEMCLPDDEPDIVGKMLGFLYTTEHDDNRAAGDWASKTKSETNNDSPRLKGVHTEESPRWEPSKEEDIHGQRKSLHHCGQEWNRST